MKRIVFITAALFLCSISLLAQTKIKGVVVDKAGQPLMDVQVTTEANDVVTTDIDGRFEVSANKGQKLIFTMLGVKTQTRTAADDMVVIMEIGEVAKDDVLGFQGMFDINTNFSSNHGGVGADFIFGDRVRPYYHVGAGLGLHSLLNSEINDYNVITSLYLSNTFYIPTKSKVSPLFDCGLGCNFGWLGISHSYNQTVLGLYAKAGFGFDTGLFRMSAGYELIGTHTGYVRIGFNF